MMALLTLRNERMRLRSLEGCHLAIGAYPRFKYDARGGGGEAISNEIIQDGLRSFSFDPNNFNIPPLNWRTTKFLGFPLPPGLEIKIKTEKLEGLANPSNGEVSLEFEARFQFSIWSLIKAPELIVNTSLTSGIVKSQRHLVEGKKLDAYGKTKLVGIAMVPKSGNIFLDAFLKLPNEALAVLNCVLQNNSDED